MKITSCRQAFVAVGVGMLALSAAAAPPADSEEDALSLSSAPVQSQQPARDLKLFVEGAIGVGDPRDGSNARVLRRASVDLSFATQLAPGWRAVLSDRFDWLRPNDLSSETTINSLREAYVTWQGQGGSTVAEAGRVNLRYGPGYGYNPTDFFRDGALRTLTSLDPFSLRENRLGTVLVRGQRLWSDGSVSLAYSPKLERRSTVRGFDLDLGATNNRHRGLLVLSQRASERLSGQALLYKDDGLPVAFGASVTALVSDAVVAYAEGMHGREPTLLARTTGASSPEVARNRLVAGATYTSSSKLSITGEVEYNGFALRASDFDALGAGAPATQRAYVLKALELQDLASRRAYVAYVTQKSLALKNLDLTALLRINGGDHSRLVWVELRHHWERVDLALRLQQQWARDRSEYTYVPDRRSAQLVADYYF